MSDNISKQAKDEIDLLALVKTIWNCRRSVLRIILLFLGVGLIFAVLSPKEFTATSTFIPQTGDSGKPGTSLGGLASLAGISLGGAANAGSDIPPTLYPKIVSSVTFRKALLEAKFHINGIKEKVTYRQYYEEIYNPSLFELLIKYSVGIPLNLINRFRNSQDIDLDKNEIDLLKISKEEFEHFNRLDFQLSVSPNEKEGFVTLTFSMPEAIMAAEMAKFAEELLQKEVINYKIQNAKDQLDFTEERFIEKKKEFEEIQQKLAFFKDRNQNIVTSTVRNQLEKIEAEYNFTLAVYTELAKQLEQAKLQVAKDTPVLSIIQPVSVPFKKSSPNRPLILLSFLVFGAIYGIGRILFKEIFKGLKDDWNSI
jgi:hypothetical protein